MWPDVIESVKRRRRLTWSLLSASAQVLAVDDKHITIGIVNAGARDSFIRSESEQILVDAFVEVTGIKRKIEVIVDPSVSPTSVAAKVTRTVEDPEDETQLSGTELLMKELGAQVIAESDK
jgi:DNA polymerase-3 subunit gamma/tau